MKGLVGPRKDNLTHLPHMWETYGCAGQWNLLQALRDAKYRHLHEVDCTIASRLQTVLEEK